MHSNQYLCHVGYAFNATGSFLFESIHGMCIITKIIVMISLICPGCDAFRLIICLPSAGGVQFKLEWPLTGAYTSVVLVILIV